VEIDAGGGEKIGKRKPLSTFYRRSTLGPRILGDLMRMAKCCLHGIVSKLFWEEF
jgi:hypothetical protein